MSLLRTSIEDVAFREWSGIGSALEFTTRFLKNYPGFADIWDSESLATALENRV